MNHAAREPWRHRLSVVMVLSALLITGCSQDTASPPAREASPSTSPSTQPPSIATTPSLRASVATPSPTSGPADPRWVFFTDGRTPKTSAWFPGSHPVMIDFGCTKAPYYSSDARCPGGQGFHHGIDVAIPCDTPLTAGREAHVLDNDGLGPAYGTTPVLLRVEGHDVVIGHTHEVTAAAGEELERGETFALVSDSGAPDGCHLHFESRRAGSGVSGAVDPAELLGLE